MDYVIAILQVSGIVILCYIFVMFGISGKLKTFLSDSCELGDKVKIKYRDVHSRTLTNDVQYFPPQERVY